jgi:hypothetical protein
VANGGRTRGVVIVEEKVRATGYHLRRKGDGRGGGIHHHHSCHCYSWPQSATFIQQIRGFQLESKDGRDTGWREGRLGRGCSNRDE